MTITLGDKWIISYRIFLLFVEFAYIFLLKMQTEWQYSAWNSRRLLITVWYDYVCDGQESFSAGHNDRQGFKIQ